MTHSTTSLTTTTSTQTFKVAGFSRRSTRSSSVKLFQAQLKEFHNLKAHRLLDITDITDVAKLSKQVFVAVHAVVAQGQSTHAFVAMAHVVHVAFVIHMHLPILVILCVVVVDRLP